MKNKILLISLLLITGLITACDGNGTSDSIGGGSNETTSSSGDPTIGEVKTFRVTPTNFNSGKFIYSSVEQNSDYTDEFSISSGGYISSTVFKGITKIVSSIYQTYNNMEMYSGTSSNGTLITAEKVDGHKQATITYNFTTPTDSFYYKNTTSDKRQHIYYIDIYYTGETITDGSSSGGSTSSNHTYTSFTSSEQSTFKSVVGYVIPFAPCDEYYIEEYEEEYEDYGITEVGIYGYFAGLTKAEFNSYKNSLTYTFDDSEKDSDGDTWYYYYITSDVYFDIVYYTEEGVNYLVFYAYTYESGSSSGSYGDSDWEDATDSINEIYTNEDKGISSLINDNGYTKVDFDKNTKITNVTEQGLYIGGCPTKEDVNVLVIPVEFSDVKASSKQDLDALDFALNGGNDESSLDYGMSLKTFFNLSSYGQLNLNFEIMGDGKKWYSPDESFSTYCSQDLSAGDYSTSTADIDIIDSIMKKYDSEVDWSRYDSDENGYVDAVMIVPSVDINSDDDASILQWAYRYWAIKDITYDGVTLNDYLWCPYNFLFEIAPGDYNGTTPTNNYTLMHEFGHILGADDYYDAGYTESATLLDGNDIMDAGFGDHNPFTKFNYGWLTSSRLVTASESVTLDLEAFEKAGDSIIIANNWDSNLGCYQEYWVLMYYTKEKANKYSTYDFDEGIIMYHINAQLIDYEYYGENYIDIYTTNNQDSYYNTGVNLIELEKVNGSSYSLQVGQTSSASIQDDYGDKINYTFKLNSINAGVANITFTTNK